MKLLRQTLSLFIFLLATSAVADDAADWAMWISNNGNVGIGTNNPNTELDVVGVARSTSYFSTAFTTPTEQGAWLNWNRSGLGITAFVNQRGGGSGGFEWLLFDKDNKIMSAPMILNPHGNLVLEKNISARQITLKGGTPGAGKVLTSDANGLASWQSLPGSTASFSDSESSASINYIIAIKGPSPTGDGGDLQGTFLGEVKMFAGKFAPSGWAFCHGQILPVDKNKALFNFLGTSYGGDGTTTFALPNLRGKHSRVN